MCSIMSYAGKDLQLKDFAKGFEETVSRGPDLSRIIETKSGIMAFHRLSIMGLAETGMQPFQLGESYAVCNGELYGFRSLKKELEERAMSLHRKATARSYCLCTESMASKCFAGWMRNSR